MTSVNDPVERLAVDLEIYGIPQSPDMPPMTETYLHVRRRQDTGTGTGVLGLPAFKGEKGDTGPAGMRHQGNRTTAELDGLRRVLGDAELNFTYRNTDDDSQWVWTGKTFVIYQDAYGARGDVGPPPDMTGGSVIIGGELQEAPARVIVDGAAGGGPYTVGIELPPLPPGEPGPPGKSGPIYDSVDVAGIPLDGDTLVHDSATGKLHWTPLSSSVAIPEYVVPPQNFPTVDKSSGDVRHTLCSVTIPPQRYPYRIDVSGGVDINARVGHQVDVEIRVGDAVNGDLIGYGRGQDGEGWREVSLRSHSEVAILPGSEVQVMPADKQVTVYASAVKKAGIIFGWGIRRDRANLRLRLLAVL